MDMGKWKGLFDWSMRYQDGTHSAEGVKELSPEKQKWLEAALSDFMKDFAERMREIKDALSSGEQEGAAAADKAQLSLADKEALCDELMELVESLDHARDLHKIGGLPTLLQLLSSPHPSLRWRAAEIAATCMANNPPVQRWFMEGGALAPLLALLADSNTLVQTKAVLALSALVRHYQPGLEAFRLAGGLQQLLALLGCNTDTSVPPAEASLTPPQQQPPPAAAAAEASSDCSNDYQQQQQQQRRRLERKVLALLQYVLCKHPADCIAAAQFGAARQLGLLLAGSSSDSDMRQAVLAVLLELVGQPQGWQWVRQHTPGLVPQLQQLLEQHRRLPAEEQNAEAEEGQLLQRVLVVLQADQAPAGAVGLQDHIELDPYLDGGERAEKTVNMRQPKEEQQQEPQVSGGNGAGLALMAVPKPDLR